jgi:K(+)-stimulated pyrophosphate-energized sodium pump
LAFKAAIYDWADVYESYIVTVTAVIFLAAILGLPAQHIEIIMLFATLALVVTFVDVNLLKTSGVKHPSSIRMAIYATIALSVVLFFIGSFLLGLEAWRALVLAASHGALMAPVIVKITDYYTSYSDGSARRIVNQAKISPATVIITGYGFGHMSAISIIAVIAAVLGVSYAIGFYAVPVTAILSTWPGSSAPPWPASSGRRHHHRRLLRPRQR